MIPTIVTTALGYFTKATLGKLVGTIWKGLCDFISTPIGAALVAGLLMYNVGKIHEYRVVNARWQAKWNAAEVKAEAERKQRDADIAKLMKADADKRLATINARKDELEGMVKKYEDEEARQRAVGNVGKAGCNCLTDRTDAEWLQNAQQGRAKAKPKAGGRYTFRMRTLGR